MRITAVLAALAGSIIALVRLLAVAAALKVELYSQLSRSDECMATARSHTRQAAPHAWPAVHLGKHFFLLTCCHLVTL
jgi:hypothetical protein